MTEIPEHLRKYQAEIEQGLATASRRAAEFAFNDRSGQSRPRPYQVVKEPSPENGANRRKAAACIGEAGQGGEAVRGEAAPQTGQTEYIRCWPLQGMAAARSNLGGAWRLYMLAKHLDQSGRGAIDGEALTRAARAQGIAPRTLARWQAQAEKAGLIKPITKTGGKWYLLASHQDACIATGCHQVGRLTQIRLRDLFREGWRATLWAAYEQTHQGRPITRAKQESLTGVPISTQRALDNQARVTRQSNYCLTGLSPDHIPGLKDIGRPGVFVWQYRKHGKTITQAAYRLPDSRRADHLAESMGKGRAKKVNKAINQRLNVSSIIGRDQSSDCMAEGGVYLRLFNRTGSQTRSTLRKASKADYNQGEIYQDIRTVKKADLWQAHPLAG